MDTKLKSVIEEAIYDTFSGYFHPDEWEGLTEKAIAQIEATEQIVAAELLPSVAKDVEDDA